MTAVRCAVHRRRLDRASRHAAACLRCQAAGARQRQMLRALRTLAYEEEEAPGHLMAAVMSALDAPMPAPRPVRNKAAIAGGTAVAIATAAAIAVRHRRVA